MTQTYSIPAALLTRLRHLQATSQALTEGCAAGLGINLVTHRVDFNLETGVITANPIAPAASDVLDFRALSAVTGTDMDIRLEPPIIAREDAS